MKIIILIATIAALGSCGERVETCNDGGPHRWGKWVDEWGDAGPAEMKQTRRCEKCGVAQIGYHR